MKAAPTPTLCLPWGQREGGSPDVSPSPSSPLKCSLSSKQNVMVRDSVEPFEGLDPKRCLCLLLRPPPWPPPTHTRTPTPPSGRSWPLCTIKCPTRRGPRPSEGAVGDHCHSPSARSQCILLIAVLPTLGQVRASQPGHKPHVPFPRPRLCWESRPQLPSSRQKYFL